MVLTENTRNAGLLCQAMELLFAVYDPPWALSAGWQKLRDISAHRAAKDPTDLSLSYCTGNSLLLLRSHLHPTSIKVF